MGKRGTGRKRRFKTAVMSSSPSRRVRFRFFSALMGIVLTGLLLLLIEVVFRLFAGPASDPELWIPFEQTEASRSAIEFHRERLQLHRPDRLLFWSVRPNLNISFRGVQVRTNSMGLRDDEVPGKKAGDELRILVLGESTAFGDLVEQDETFSEVLEGGLSERLPECEVSVINAGVTGYSLFQSVRYLEERGRKLNPDAVLIYHGYNDFLPTTFAAERSGASVEDAGLTDRELAEARAKFPANLDQLLSHNSTAYRWLRMLGASNDAVVLEYRTSSRSRVPEPDRWALLEQIRELVETMGARFVVLVPAYRDFGDHRKTLLEFGNVTETPTIDFERAIQSMDGQRDSLFFADGLHPRPPLHHKMAEYALTGLLESAREGRFSKLSRCLGEAGSQE